MMEISNRLQAIHEEAPDHVAIITIAVSTDQDAPSHLALSSRGAEGGANLSLAIGVGMKNNGYLKATIHTAIEAFRLMEITGVGPEVIYSQLKERKNEE